MSDASRGIVKNITSVFGTKIVVLLIGVISAVLIARGLGAEGRGIYAALLVYPSLLVALTEGGMRQASVFYLGKQKAPDAEIIGTLFTYTLFAGAGGYLAVYWLQFTYGQSQFTHLMMLAAAGMLPATMAVNAIKGVFLGKERIKQFNKASWVQKVVFVTVIASLYFTNLLTVTTAILATLSAAIFNLFQALIFLKAKETSQFSFNAQTFFPMFKIGIIYGLAFFFITANYRIDILLLSWLSVPAEVGRYALAVQLGELLWQLPGAALVVLMSATANSESKAIVDTIAKTTRVTFFITLLSALPFLVLCFLFITPLFGDAFTQTFNILLYLLPGLVVASIFKTINSYFAGQGQPHVTIFLMGAVVMINVGLNYLLIPLYGANGAGIATSISYALSAIGCCLLMIYREEVSILDLLVLKKDDIKNTRW